MFETNILRTLKRNKTLSNDGFDLGFGIGMFLGVRKLIAISEFRNL